MDRDWKEVLRKNFTKTKELLDYLELDNHLKEKVLEKHPFPLHVPLRLAQKMQKGTLEDPILRQFLPLLEENQAQEGFINDPVHDLAFRQTGKLLKKYRTRSLILATSACAMHCRYCFRRNYPYETSLKDFEHELTLIREDATCEEVILSGGDPLSLSDERLQDLLEKLATIPHVNKIRFHTRFPVGIPERITETFLNILENCPSQILFIVHINHPLELDDEVKLSLKKVMKLGIPILLHTVLLRGVNDSEETLAELFSKASSSGIIPYYLFQLDKVSGASHFEVDQNQGKELVQKLQARLPGYAVPKYALEIPGKPHKTLLMEETTSCTDPLKLVLRR